MYKLNLDPEGYLLSISYEPGGVEAGEPAIDTLAGLDLEGNRISAHRWDGEKLILDKEKLAAIDAEKDKREEIENRPSFQEQIRADVDYIAAMTGVNL